MYIVVYLVSVVGPVASSLSSLSVPVSSARAISIMAALCPFSAACSRYCMAARWLAGDAWSTIQCREQRMKNGERKTAGENAIKIKCKLHIDS